MSKCDECEGDKILKNEGNNIKIKALGKMFVAYSDLKATKIELESELLSVISRPGIREDYQS